jgi:hypothetical protein
MLGAAARDDQVRLMGRFYAQAGMLLRVVQSDALVPGPALESVGITNPWPFEVLPTR